MSIKNDIKRVSKLNQKLNSELKDISRKFSEHLNVPEYEIDVFYQTDGLCILFQEDYNTPISYIDLDLFFTLTPEESFKYLRERTV